MCQKLALKHSKNTYMKTSCSTLLTHCRLHVYILKNCHHLNSIKRPKKKKKRFIIWTALNFNCLLYIFLVFQRESFHSFVSRLFVIHNTFVIDSLSIIFHSCWFYFFLPSMGLTETNAQFF